jgi:hypothetical protein
MAAGARLALGAAFYLVACAGVLASFNLGLPSWLELTLSALIAPGIIAVTAWNPVLRLLGLTSGEWIAVPSAPGFLLVVLVYAGLAYGAGFLLERLRR